MVDGNATQPHSWDKCCVAIDIFRPGRQPEDGDQCGDPPGPVDYEYFIGQALNVLAVDAKQAAPATYTRPVPLGYTVSVGGYCYLPAKPTRWRRPLGPFSLGRGHAYGISRHLGASDWNSAQVSVTIGFNRSANCSDEIRRFFGSGEQQLSFPFGVEPNHSARPRICDVQGVSVGS